MFEINVTVVLAGGCPIKRLKGVSMTVKVVLECPTDSKPSLRNKARCKLGLILISVN